MSCPLHPRRPTTRSWFLWLGSLALLLAGCQSPTRHARALPTDQAAPLDETSFETITFAGGIQAEWLRPPTDLFRVGPGDVIEVENIGEPEEPATLLLTGPDGKIYYSTLPGLSVWGLTLAETRTLLETELSRYARVRPTLAVTLRAVGSKRIWILGSVQSPGVYSLASPVNVLEAIALAGGIGFVPGSSSGMPDLENSFIMRNGDMLRVDLHRLISEGDLSQNIYLQPDDFLYLRSGISRDVFVLGAVATPNIVPYHDQLSLLSALLTVGGTAPYAKVTQVAVVRGSLSTPKVALIDYQAIATGRAPDLLLEQGDIVYVPFVAYRKLGVLAEQMIQTLVRTVAANEGNRATVSDAQAIGVTSTATVGP